MKLVAWIAKDDNDNAVVSRTRFGVVQKAASEGIKITGTKKIEVEYSNSFDLFEKLTRPEPPIMIVREYDSNGNLITDADVLPVAPGTVNQEAA